MLARRLKQARLRLGVSQEKLGKLAGIDESSASARMNQYERGKHAPDFSLMQRLAKILGMPASWFYTDDDDMARLLEIFFRLDSGDRKRLLALAEALELHKKAHGGRGLNGLSGESPSVSKDMGHSLHA